MLEPPVSVPLIRCSPDGLVFSTYPRRAIQLGILHQPLVLPEDLRTIRISCPLFPADCRVSISGDPRTVPASGEVVRSADTIDRHGSLADFRSGNANSSRSMSVDDEPSKIQNQRPVETRKEERAADTLLAADTTGHTEFQPPL